MANQIEREVWVKQDKLKNPVHYVRGTDLLPIVFHFRDFTIPSGATARVFVAKPDGNAVYDSATIEGNDVTVDVTDQMFLVLGMTLMQISIFDGEEELVTFAQPVMVEQNLKAGDLPKSTTDVSFLDDAIEQANQAVNTATTAASQAAQAVQNANQAIADANEAISDLNEQIASLNTNFATLANSVSISQLDTTAKTLVGAVNELNSKTFLLKFGIEIDTNEDLNNLIEPGTYFSKNSKITASLENCPLASFGFIMTVNYATGNNQLYICQTIYGRLDSFTPIRYVRHKRFSEWGEWYSFSDDATVLSKTGIELYGEQVIDAVPSTEYTTVGQINVKEGNNLIMVYAMFNSSRPIGLKLQTTSGVDVAVVESNNLAITLSLFIHVNADVTYNILLKCLSNSVATNNVYTSILHLG